MDPLELLRQAKEFMRDGDESSDADAAILCFTAVIVALDEIKTSIEELLNEVKSGITTI